MVVGGEDMKGNIYAITDIGPTPIALVKVILALVVHTNSIL